MNNATRFIMGIYQVSLMVRDTLEYVQGRPEHDINFYNQRKQIILHGLEDNSPLSHFLSQNGEVGEKIKTNLHDFVEFAYSDESTYLTVENGKLIVDHAQDLKALDYIIGLRETLMDIIKRFVEKTKEDGTYEEAMDNLVKQDEQFYRVLSSLIIFDLTHKAFIEFNKAMRDNNGQPSPQSNFVVNDMKKLVGYTKFVNEHSNKEDSEYQEIYQLNFTCLNYMEGSKPLPNNNGLKGEIDSVHEKYVQLLAKRELPWRQVYSVVWNELVGFEQGLRQAREANKESN